MGINGKSPIPALFAGVKKLIPIQKTYLNAKRKRRANMSGRIGRTLALGIFILVTLFIVRPGWSQNESSGPDRMLVKFHKSAPENVKAAIHRYHGCQVLDAIPQLDVHVVETPKNKIKEMLRAYRKEGWVELAEPDYVATTMLSPNDPSFGSQWGMAKIQAPAAWDISRGDGIRIAICDTGIDQNHADLAGKIVANKNFTSSFTVDDRYGHGTHVAGIAAAATNNGRGVAGAGFNASLMNVKVLGDNGSGYYSWIANGITWAADNGAKVINLSLGGPYPSTVMEEALKYAWAKGSVIVAAAGNNGTDAPSYPAAYNTSCIAVAATDANDGKASFSNYGLWVDVAAPGVNIYSTLPNHSNRIGRRNYGSLSGTSMAAPHVSGIAALIWAAFTGINNVTVRDRIEGTGDQVGDIWSDYGIERVNAYYAVQSPY